MSIEDFFNSTVEVQRVTREDDDAGNWDEVWNTLISGLHCCIQPRKTFEFVAHNKEQGEVTHIMYAKPTAIGMRPSDRVVFGSEIFEIIGPPRDIDYLGRFLTMDLKQVVAD